MICSDHMGNYGSDQRPGDHALHRQNLVVITKAYGRSNACRTAEALVLQRLAILEPNSHHGFAETSLLFTGFDNLHSDKSVDT